MQSAGGGWQRVALGGLRLCGGGCGEVATGAATELLRYELVAEVLTDGGGNLFLLDEVEVGQHLDELLAAVVDVQVFLQHDGRGDEQLGDEVEVARLAPEGGDLRALVGFAR